MVQHVGCNNLIVRYILWERAVLYHMHVSHARQRIGDASSKVRMRASLYLCLAKRCLKVNPDIVGLVFDELHIYLLIIWLCLFLLCSRLVLLTLGEQLCQTPAHLGYPCSSRGIKHLPSISQSSEAPLPLTPQRRKKLRDGGKTTKTATVFDSWIYKHFLEFNSF